MGNIQVPIRGMHCASCEVLISQQLKKIEGVTLVHVSQKKAKADIEYKGEPPSDIDIAKAVQEAGYEVGEKERLPWISRSARDYKDLVTAVFVLGIIYGIARWLNLFDLSVSAPSSGVGVALLVGLVAGVSTCMALIGGLVLSLSARHAELHPEATTRQKFRPHVYFNIGRILGYAVFGGIIGLIGKAVSPSANVLGILTVLVGAVMLFFGLKLVEIFPALRDKNITLPSGIARLFGFQKEVKEYSHKSAMAMGALTFFLPCGFTQAMQLYAVSTGSFWTGMAVMGLFAIGTAPGLLGIGGLTSVFKGRRARIFFMTAGLAVILLGWFNIQNGMRLVGGSQPKNTNTEVISQEEQIVRMTQGASGYTPKVLHIEKGRPVKWIINSTSSFTCASSIVVPSYGISRTLQPGENVITFVPTKTGEISFSCSMGMYRGKFIVADSSNAGGDVRAKNAGTQELPSAPYCETDGTGCETK